MYTAVWSNPARYSLYCLELFISWLPLLLLLHSLSPTQYWDETHTRVRAQNRFLPFSSSFCPSPLSPVSPLAAKGFSRGALSWRDIKIRKGERGRAVCLLARQGMGMRHAKALRKGRSFPSRALLEPLPFPTQNSRLLLYVAELLEAA